MFAVVPAGMKQRRNDSITLASSKCKFNEAEKIPLSLIGGLLYHSGPYNYIRLCYLDFILLYNQDSAKIMQYYDA